MEERRAELEAGRLSTTFLLLSPPPPREGVVVSKVDNYGSPCPNASPVDGQDQSSVNRSSNNFPDDEAEEEGPSAAQEGASLDSIGRVSDGPFDDRSSSACTTSRLELSPIPCSARPSDAIRLPVSTENNFLLDADGPDEGRPSIDEEGASVSPAEVRDRTAAAAAAATDPTSTQADENQRDDESSAEEDDRRDDVNDSVASKDGSVASRRSSVGELEMERMTEELGASSLEFIRRIRAAAFRRKLDVARSRDSLAAKEREREKALAEARAAAERKAARDRRVTEPLVPLHTIQSSDRDNASPSKSKSLFHARPVPKTTGPKGSGGLSGVPKIVKKPTTIPHSPLLGNRRGRQPERTPKDELPPQPTLDDDDSDSSRSPSPKRDQNIFRALPLPKSSTDSGHAGMVGVPKVPKRPSTVPSSPALGFRRRPEKETMGASEGPNAGSSGAATQGIPTVKKRPTTVPRSPLLGLRRFAQQKRKGASASSTADTTATTQPAESKSQQRTRRSASSSLSASTSVTPLVGLHLVESGSQIVVPTTSRKEDRSNRSVAKERHGGEDGYRPHSTARAAERAQFQEKKVELEKERQETLSRLRRQQVKELKREMEALRSSLS